MTRDELIRIWGEHNTPEKMTLIGQYSSLDNGDEKIYAGALGNGIVYLLRHDTTQGRDSYDVIDLEPHMIQALLTLQAEARRGW